MAKKDELLPNPLTKARRDRHPSEPDSTAVSAALDEVAAAEVATAPAAPPTPPPTTPATSSSRVGPNRVRKSLYMPADIAADFTELVDAIHYDSRGTVSKADAAGALLRRAIGHADEVYRSLNVQRS